MTHDEYIAQTNGQPVDYDQAFGPQCVDLARDYCKKVLNVTLSPPVEGAKDIWNTYNTKSFTRIENTPEAVVQAGDIVIWGSSYGKYGHIAIALSGNKERMQCLSQNDPVGTKTQVRNYTYKHVLGWLRPIGAPMITQKEIDDLRLARDNNWNLYQETLQHLNESKELNKTITDQLSSERRLSSTNFDIATHIAVNAGVELEQTETLYSILVKLRDQPPQKDLGALQLLTKSFQKMIKGEWL